MAKMAAEIITGKAIAQKIQTEIAQEIASFKANGLRVPMLVVFLVGDDAASQVYVKKKQQACQKIGIECAIINLAKSIQPKELIKQIEEKNLDELVDGIIVQLPLPPHLPSAQILMHISPQKDVDGLTALNQGLLNLGLQGLYPCTPLGILAILENLVATFEEKLVAVIGQSTLVGAPTTSLLTQKGATTIAIHRKTLHPARLSSMADIIVVAAGSPGLITQDWVKPKAIIVDVGINRKNGKLIGDVDVHSVSSRASIITAVPGGVGPVTVAMLLKNCLLAYKRHQESKPSMSE